MQHAPILIVSHHSCGFPWLGHLAASNPGHRLFHEIDRRPGPPDEMWRNCDRFLRTWWRAHRRLVSTSHLWLLEHDVLATAPLPPVEHVAGMAGKDIHAPGSPWFWMRREAGKLPPGMEPHGIAPLAVTCFHRDALDAIASPAWDHLFAADIFCELRLPSIIRYCGFPLESLPLPHVTATAVTPGDAPGVYHAVKNQWLKP